jgi:putative transcriptional regulator
LIKFKLAKELERQNKTMYWLSKESGVRPNTISQWVNNDNLPKEKQIKSINVDTLNTLCETLDCKLEDIIEFVNNKKDDAE